MEVSRRTNEYIYEGMDIWWKDVVCKHWKNSKIGNEMWIGDLKISIPNHSFYRLIYLYPWIQQKSYKYCPKIYDVLWLTKKAFCEWKRISITNYVIAVINFI